VLPSSALASSCCAVTIDLEPRMLGRPDHAPVIAAFGLIGASEAVRLKTNDKDSPHVSL